MVSTRSQTLKNSRGKKTKKRKSPRHAPEPDRFIPLSSPYEIVLKIERKALQICRNKFGPPLSNTKEYFENATLEMVDREIRPLLEEYLSRKQYNTFTNFKKAIDWAKDNNNQVYLYSWQGYTFTKVGRLSNFSARFNDYNSKHEEECIKIRLYGPF